MPSIFADRSKHRQLVFIVHFVENVNGCEPITCYKSVSATNWPTYTSYVIMRHIFFAFSIDSAHMRIALMKQKAFATLRVTILMLYFADFNFCVHSTQKLSPKEYQLLDIYFQHSYHRSVVSRYCFAFGILITTEYTVTFPDWAAGYEYSLDSQNFSPFLSGK